MRLTERLLVPERMDAPDLDPALHRHALIGLRRINWWSGASRQIARCIHESAKRIQLPSIRILDVGCGGGDVAAHVAQYLLKRGWQCMVQGWDMSPTAIDEAKSFSNRFALQATSDPACEFQVRNIFADAAEQRPDSGKPFDFVYCSLFLHHFDFEEAAQVLRRMKELAVHGVIVDDLLRTQLGYWLAKIAVRILSQSPIVHFDGPQSVRAAFTQNELRQLFLDAGMKNAHFSRHWPQRVLACWESATH